MSRRIAQRNEAAFCTRFEQDAASEMTPDQWSAWVDALPVDEFMFMVSLKTGPSVPNGERRDV